MALIISARSLADLSRARFTPKLEPVFKMSKSKDVAKSYQHVSLFQREEGKKLIDDVQIYRGYVILDLGCGTGELSAYLSELAGQDGRVVAVDPDSYRVEVARIVKSVDVRMEDLEFENVESMCTFFSATNQGRFVSELATRDKVSSFCAQYTGGENSKPLTLYTDEGDYYCVLIATKP